MSARPLPEDITTLQQMLVARDETIARLLAEIARLKRWQYGSSSERLADLMGQLQLALTDLPASPPESAGADAVPPEVPPAGTVPTGIAPGQADGADIAADRRQPAGLARSDAEGIQVAAQAGRRIGIGRHAEREVVAAGCLGRSLLGEQVYGLAHGQRQAELFIAVAEGGAALAGADVNTARGLAEVGIETGGLALVLDREAGAEQLARDDGTGITDYLCYGGKLEVS